jgi:hypothetical protein
LCLILNIAIDSYVLDINTIVGELNEKMKANQDSVGGVKENDEKESDSEESTGETNTTPTKIKYDFQGSNRLKKLFQSPGSGVTVHLPLRSDMKSMSYFFVLLSCSSPIWWIDGKFLQGVVNHVFGQGNPKSSKPGWMKTFEKYHIHCELNGNNRYKCGNRGNFVGYIGFAFDIKTKNEKNAIGEIKSIVNFIYGVLKGYAESKKSGSTTLD